MFAGTGTGSRHRNAEHPNRTYDGQPRRNRDPSAPRAIYSAESLSKIKFVSAQDACITFVVSLKHRPSRESWNITNAEAHGPSEGGHSRKHTRCLLMKLTTLPDDVGLGQQVYQRTA